MNFVAEALNLSLSAARRLEDRNILRRALVKHPFFQDVVEAFRLDKKFGVYEEGTVVVKTKDGPRIFRGFPKIKRILVLNPALRKHFGNSRIALEEKMNGYNVRVVRIGDNLYGITRRGLICPYTTEKVRERFEDEFFREYPDYMLCCEAVGKASPYVPTEVYGIDGLEFFLFDIRHCKTNKPVSVETKEEIASRYGLKMVDIHLITAADDLDNIKAVISDLNENKREGIVFKDVKMLAEPLKYTTSYANISDLSYAFSYFGEYGRDFMLSRIVREAFQSFEFQETEREFDERCLRLGKAILESMRRSIEHCSKGGTIYEETTLSFSSNDVFELFLKHLRLLGVDFRVEVLEEGDGVRAKFKRVMRSTTDKIRGILEGRAWK